MGTRHITVLLNECTAFMQCKKGGTYVDATLGNGGHSLQLLQSYPDIHLLVGIDCDPQAVQRAQQNLAAFSEKATIVHGNFGDVKTVLATEGIHTIDGILFDLGVSTNQLKEPSRGFSFMLEGALDMRMNTSTPLTAGDILQQSSVEELSDLLRTYGEERWAKRIAGRIKEQSMRKPVESTRELADIVAQAIPAKHRPAKMHPATKTFQALRIAVNRELQVLEQGLDQAIELVNSGGRLCVISFHSLEDRIVKNRFKLWAKNCICPPRTPVCGCNHVQKATIVTKKPVVPSGEELQANPRARSAKLRVAQKL